MITAETHLGRVQRAVFKGESLNNVVETNDGTVPVTLNQRRTHFHAIDLFQMSLYVSRTDKLSRKLDSLSGIVSRSFDPFDDRSARGRKRRYGY
jgi:hypothetical protein